MRKGAETTVFVLSLFSQLFLSLFRNYGVLVSGNNLCNFEQRIFIETKYNCTVALSGLRLGGG